MKNQGTEKLNEMLKQKLKMRNRWDIPLCRWYYINNGAHYNGAHYEHPRCFYSCLLHDCQHQ